MDGLKLIRKQDIQDTNIVSVTTEVVNARTSVKQTYPTLKARLDAIDTNANNYILKTGDTMTGNLNFDNVNVGLSHAGRVFLRGVNNSTVLSSNTGGQIYLRPNGNNDTNNQVAINNNGQVTAPLFNGNLNGNSTSATKLQTPKKINGTDFDGTKEIVTEKWGTVREIKIGNITKQVDGSQNINFTLQDIGASDINHNHDNRYLKLTGGTLTGDVNTNSSINFTTANTSGIRYNNNLIIRNNGTSTVLSSINNTIYLRPQGDTNATNQVTIATNGDVTANRFVGNLQGNSATTTRLQTGRRINGVLFDGTGDINIGINPANVNLNGYVKPNTGGAISPNDSLNQAFGKLEFGLDGKANSNHTHNYAGSNTAGGVANSSHKLETARAITLAGAITGTANFDGTTGITINTTLANPLKNRLQRLRRRVVINSTTNNVAIGIGGYNPNNDVLNVYLSGVRLEPVDEYNATQTTVTLVGNRQFINGDVVTFEVVQLA